MKGNIDRRLSAIMTGIYCIHVL